MTAIASRPWPDVLLVRLEQAQREFGCLTPEVMTELARSFDLALNDVYGVATFYSFLSTRPAARNVIRICKSVPCYLKNNQVIIDTVRKELGLKIGEATADGRFSLELTNCLGLCDQAPAMMVNHDPHNGLDPGKIANILSSYK